MHLTKLACPLTVAAFLLSITVFSGVGTSRVERGYDRIFAPYFTKVGVANWGAGGAYIAEWGRPTAAFTNPAGLSTERAIIYAEAGKRFPAHWLGMKQGQWDNQFIVPGFLSVAKPFRNLSLSIGYMNYYDLSNEDSIEVTTSESPEGMPEYYHIENRLKIHTFFASGSYAIENMASVGLTIGLNCLKEHEWIAEVSADGHGLGIQLVAGGLLSPFEGLNIGGAFRYSTKIEYDMQYRTGAADTFSTNPDIDSNLKPEPIPCEAKFPWSLQVGASYRPIADVKVLGMLDFQKWSIVSDGYEDKIQVHLGTEISSLEPFTFGFGFFTQEYPWKDKGRYFKGRDFDQKFISAGFRVKLWKSFELSTSFVDSHLFPNKEVEKDLGKDAKQFHQSYIATGIRISL